PRSGSRRRPAPTSRPSSSTTSRTTSPTCPICPRSEATLLRPRDDRRHPPSVVAFPAHATHTEGDPGGVDGTTGAVSTLAAMRRRTYLSLALALTVLAISACQSSRAQRGDYPREGGMAAPTPTPAAPSIHDRPAYTVHDAL